MNFQLVKGLAILALIVHLAVHSAFAAEVVIENSGTFDDTSSGWHDIGQTFTATKTGVLSDIQVADDGGGVSGTATLNIYSGSGSGGSLLYSKSGIDFNAIDTITDPSNYTFHTITIDSAVNITSGSTYTFVLTPGQAFDIAYQFNTDNYAGGDLYSDDLGGMQTGLDMAFKITQGDATPPVITSAIYNATTNVMTVTGTGFTAKAGALNDIDLSKLTVKGQAGGTHTLTAASDIEITNSTSFSFTLSGADLTAVEALLNFNGTSSLDFTTYNLAAADDWMANVTTGDSSDLTGNGITVSNTSDSDGNLTSAVGITEPVNLTTTVDTTGEAVNLFDFTLSDGGASDGTAMTISNVDIHVSGTSSDAERAKITWRLNGNDASHVTGVYNSGSDTITFSSLSISVADGANETYTVNAYFNDNTGLTNGNSIILSVDGDTDLTLGGGTQMASTSPVTNSTGTVIEDNIFPTINSVGLPPNATYIAGQNLDFTVNYDENIAVNTGGGTPQLALTVGATSRFASYQSGSGTTALLFRYTVPSGDEDNNGISLGATVDPNNGTLQDSAGNTANNTLSSSGSLTGIKIDALASVVTEVTAVTTPGLDSTPDVTISNTEAGNLHIGGSCGSGDEGAISSGSTTITITQPDNSTPLAQGAYSDCTATVTDAAGNVSNTLSMSGFTIDLTAPGVNTNAGKSLNEGDTAIAIDSSLLASNDNFSTADNVTYTLVSAPGNGVLRNNGSTLIDGNTFTQENINNNLITYDHDSSETTSDSFTFKVADQVSNVNDNTSNNFAFNIAVTPQNDPPTAISLANSTVNQSDGADAPVGTLNSTDSDSGSFSYSIVSSGTAANGICSAASDNALFNISGSTLRATDATSLRPGNHSTCIQSNDTTTTFEQTLTVNVTDDINPTIVTFSPAVGSTGVSTTTDLTLTFNEDLVKGTGNITLVKYSDDSILQAIDVNTTAVTLSHNVVTISHNNAFSSGSQYYVMIDATALDDASGNSFAGISSKDTYKFTTVSVSSNAPLPLPPVVESSSDTIITELQNTQAIVGSDSEINISQGSDTDNLTATLGDTQFNLRTLSIELAADEAKPGITVTEDGLVQMVTDQGKQVIVVAELNQADDLVSELETFGYTIQPQDFGMMRISFIESASSNDIWFATRAAYDSSPAETGAAAGLFAIPSNLPVNTVRYVHYFTQDEILYRQTLYPTSADWGNLKNYLNTIGTVDIDTEGRITFQQDNEDNTYYNVIMDYEVQPSNEGNGQIQISPTGDINGDEKDDYVVVYPNGDKQILYMLAIE